jgi:hypothetical protein
MRGLQAVTSCFNTATMIAVYKRTGAGTTGFTG